MIGRQDPKGKADRHFGVAAPRAFLVIAGAVISLASIMLVARGVDLDQTRSIVASAEPAFLFAGLGVLALQTVIRSLRWGLLLPLPDGRPAPSIARIVPVLLVGYLGNAVLPARLGEAARALLLARRERLSRAETIGSVILERVIDTLALGGLGVAAATVVGVPGWASQLAVAGVALAVTIMLALSIAPALLGRIHLGRLARVVGAAIAVVRGAAVADRPIDIAWAAVLSLCAWLLDASIYWLVARSLGIELAIVAAVLISTITVLATAVPSAPGYVGTFELAAVAGAGLVGIEPTTALAFALVSHVLAVVPIALAGAVSLVAIGADARMSFLRSAGDRPAP